MERNHKSVKDDDRMDQEIEWYKEEMLRINEELLQFNDKYLNIIENQVKLEQNIGYAEKSAVAA